MGTIGFDFVDLKVDLVDLKREFSICDMLWTSIDLLFVLAAGIPERFLVAGGGPSISPVDGSSRLSLISSSQLLWGRICNTVVFVSSIFRSVDNDLARLTFSPFLLLLFVLIDSSAQQCARPLLFCSSFRTGRLGSRNCGFRTKKSVACLRLFMFKVGGISMTIGKKMPRKMFMYR